MAVKNRVVALIGEKQAREGKVINAAVVARGTGLTRQAIHAWMRGEVQSFKSETVEALCNYFNCEIGDLLYIDRDKESA